MSVRHEDVKNWKANGGKDKTSPQDRSQIKEVNEEEEAMIVAFS